MGFGWCGSVDWVLACEPKGYWFDSQSGHMPGLQARFPTQGMREATTHWCFPPSLSPSPPLSLKIGGRGRRNTRKANLVFKTCLISGPIPYQSAFQEGRKEPVCTTPLAIFKSKPKRMKHWKEEAIPSLKDLRCFLSFPFLSLTFSLMTSIFPDD